MKIFSKLFLIVLFASPIYAQDTLQIVTEKMDRRELKKLKTNAERELFVNEYVKKLNNLEIERVLH